MGLFNLFAPTPKVARNHLLLLEENDKKITKVIDDLHDFYIRILEGDPSRRLILTSSMNGCVIPAIDCDSGADHNAACQYLREKKIRYAVWQSSSQPHYWIILDYACPTFEEAWKQVCYVPGNDHKYLKIARQKQYFALRAELKNKGDHPVLKCQLCENPIVVKFIEEMSNHFAYKDRLDAIIKTKERRIVEVNNEKERQKVIASSWSY